MNCCLDRARPDRTGRGSTGPDPAECHCERSEAIDQTGPGQLGGTQTRPIRRNSNPANSAELEPGQLGGTQTRPTRRNSNPTDSAETGPGQRTSKGRRVQPTGFI